MTVIVSPHLDDAVLSCGRFMAAHHVTVLTVLAGVPTGDDVTDYDASCGFTSSHDAMLARRSEDTAACDMLGAKVIHLDFYDRQYGGCHDIDFAIDTIRAHCPPAEPVFIPVGIQHPDHLLVSQLAHIATRGYNQVVLYEEMPYRVQYPEMVFDRLTDLRDVGVEPKMMTPDLGDLDVKLAAIGRYRSQFPKGATDPALQVGERYWRLDRPHQWNVIGDGETGYRLTCVCGLDVITGHDVYAAVDAGLDHGATA